MVMEGLSDVSFLVHGTVIQALKPFLKYNNKYLASLLKEYEQSSEPIPLDDCITPEGFNTMLLYYGFGKPNPDIPYLADAMIASLFLHEIDFYNTLRSIALNKMNDELLIRIFTLVPNVKDDKIKQSLLEITVDYFISNSHRLIGYNPPIITSLDVFNYILDLPGIKVPNEKVLADMLFHIYKQSRRSEPEREAELYKKFESAACKINWNDVANVTPKDIALFHNFNIIVNNNNNNNNHNINNRRIYTNPIIVPPSPAFTYNNNNNNRIQINNNMNQQQTMQLDNTIITPNRQTKSLQSLANEISPITPQSTTPLLYQQQQTQPQTQPQSSPPPQQPPRKKRGRKKLSQSQPTLPTQAVTYDKPSRSKTVTNSQFIDMAEEVEDETNRRNNSRQNINQQYQYIPQQQQQQLNTYNNIRRGDIQPIVQLTANTTTSTTTANNNQQIDDDLLLYTNSPSANPEEPSRVRISHISPHLPKYPQQQQQQNQIQFHQPRTILQTAISNNYMSESESDTGINNNYDKIPVIPRRKSILHNNNNNNSESSTVETSCNEYTTDDEVNNELNKRSNIAGIGNNNKEMMKNTSNKRKSRTKSISITSTEYMINNNSNIPESKTPPIDIKQKRRKKNNKYTIESNDDEYVSNLEEEEEEDGGEEEVNDDDNDEDYNENENLVSNVSRKKRKVSHNVNQHLQQQQQISSSISPQQKISANTHKTRSKSKSKRGENRSDIDEEIQQRQQQQQLMLNNNNQSISLPPKSVVRNLNPDISRIRSKQMQYVNDNIPIPNMNYNNYIGNTQISHNNNNNNNNNNIYNDASFEDYTHPSAGDGFINLSNESLDDERNINIGEYLKRKHYSSSNNINNNDSIQEYQSSLITSLNTTTTIGTTNTTPVNVSNQIIDADNMNNNDDDKVLDYIVKKYTPKRSLIIDNKDRIQITQIFKEKLPILSTDMNFKYLITMLMFYKETNNYFNRYNNNCDDTNKYIVQLILHEWMNQNKSFYNNSFPDCLLPFFPLYCDIIDENGGIVVITKLLNLYKYQNKSATEDYILTNDECKMINNFIMNKHDYDAFANACYDKRDVERIYPSLYAIKDRIFSRLYEVCINRYNTISSSILSVFNHLKYTITPNNNINISKNGIITCYSEEENPLSEYTVSCTDFNGVVTSKLNIEFKKFGFQDSFKSESIILMDNNLQFTLHNNCNNNTHFHHCYFNFLLYDGVYTIKLSSKNNSSFVVGVIKNGRYDGIDLCKQNEVRGFLVDDKSRNQRKDTKLAHLRKIKKNLNENNYTFILNMKNEGENGSTFSYDRTACQIPIESPCYLFVDVIDENSTIKVESLVIERK